MENSKKNILAIIEDIKEIVGPGNVVSHIVADNQDVYDIRLKFKSRIQGKDPVEIAFSFDRDTGYYMDIDGTTWEFDKDDNLLKHEAKKYVYGLKRGDGSNTDN